MAQQSEPSPAAPGGPRKLLYYRNPMGLPDTSPVPKKDSMGMDYIPVYEGEDTDDGSIKVSVAKVQKAGVQSEPAERRVLGRAVRAPATVQVDERRQAVVSLRFDAWIDEVADVTTGDVVRKGQKLMRIYGPTLAGDAAQYASVLAGREAAIGTTTVRGSRQRLENLAVPDTYITDIERTGKVPLRIDWPAPRDGIVLQRTAVEGMKAPAGEVLFRLADLSVVWVLADVSENDLPLVAVGQTARVKPRGYPDRAFTGKVGLVYPQINKETRTARVRIEIANPDLILKPDMYAEVEIAAGSEAPVLSVPDDAVIDSGTRRIVIVDRGEGRFEPKPVVLGRQGDGYVEIREGLDESDWVVVRATFLLDAESNLKAALRGLGEADARP
ncbi:efflux transporter periplasmic adaptor subunit [Rhodoplanes roseus]|uniref:Efflux transporter periplasmic adaptor subunit n=2 Tax=Rhodoplanes roseus TaxID=29409 RepID=A0A327L1U3_9BRAD|nr:efflux transporter periplasmic adaptor subunit [Rhodoplanes roseus]